MGVLAADTIQERSIAAHLGAFSADESGATAIEYGLIVALIFIAIVAAINNYTDSTSAMYDRISETLQDGAE